MKWTQLKAGPCGATAGHSDVDPNLVWADATAFADFRRAGESHPDPFPVLLELVDDGGTGAVSPLERLHNELLGYAGGVPAIYPRTIHPAVLQCTAWFSSVYCKAVLDDPHHRLGKMIRRFQLQLPVVPERPRPARPVSPATGSEPRARGKELVVGLIDAGCPYAHLDLRDDTGLGTRILNIWDQDPEPAFTSAGGVVPADLGYGCEVSRTCLNDLMARHHRSGVVDEDACYAESGGPLLRERYAHGAAVLGLLAGRHFFGTRLPLDADWPVVWNALDDPASRADIVFVQLPRDHVQDSTSAALERFVLDGIRYIVSCAGNDTKRIVVNISDGSMRGTHDGQSIIESALAALVDEQAALGRELIIVLAAGNAYEDRRHAQFDVPSAGEPTERVLTLHLPHANESPTYVFIRVPPGLNAPSLRLDAAWLNGSNPHWVVPGEGWGLAEAGAGPGVGVIYPKRDSQHAALAMLAFRPTASRPQLAGRWDIHVKGLDQLVEPLHFYIVLGQRNSGALQRTQQPRFVDVDGRYDPNRPLRRVAKDDPTPPRSPIRRAGTLSSFTTAEPKTGVWVVGAKMWRPHAFSPYSAAGPAASKVGRHDVDLSMFVDEAPALIGMRSMGVRSGEIVRVSGTSFAAPQIARLLACEFPVTRGTGGVPGSALVMRFGLRTLLRWLRAKPRSRLTSGPGASPR